MENDLCHYYYYANGLTYKIIAMESVSPKHVGHVKQKLLFVINYELHCRLWLTIKFENDKNNFYSVVRSTNMMATIK